MIGLCAAAIALSLLVRRELRLRAAAERGRLLHALFERLPAVTPDARAAAAERWLRDAGSVADPAAGRGSRATWGHAMAARSSP